MGANHDSRDAVLPLEGLENGDLAAMSPAADPVLDQVVKLTSASPTLIRKHRAGQEDPVSRWFESNYSYRDFCGRRAEVIGLLVDKIER